MSGCSFGTRSDTPPPGMARTLPRTVKRPGSLRRRCSPPCRRRPRWVRCRPVNGGTGRLGFQARLCLLGAVALLAVGASSCSDGSRSDGSAVVIYSGQVPPGALPTGGRSAVAADATASTIPLAQQNPTTALFTAIGVFQSCLSGLGVTFEGAPDPSDPSSPANNPTYVKNLVTCATKSDILQALKAAQTAQDNLTQAQIEKENKAYLRWRKCMIGRGWVIPQPTPNAQGLLFSFGGTGSSGASGFKPPPGQSLLSSSDLEQCAAVAQQGGT